MEPCENCGAKVAVYPWGFEQEKTLCEFDIHEAWDQLFASWGEHTPEQCRNRRRERA